MDVATTTPWRRSTALLMNANALVENGLRPVPNQSIGFAVGSPASVCHPHPEAGLPTAAGAHAGAAAVIAGGVGTVAVCAKSPNYHWRGLFTQTLEKVPLDAAQIGATFTTLPPPLRRA